MTMVYIVSLVQMVTPVDIHGRCMCMSMNKGAKFFRSF